jgi:hypothetical protein
VRCALVASIIVLTLALAAPAGTAIVVQRSIAGLQLRMTKAEVRAKLGTPAKVKTGKNEFGRYTQFVYPRVTVLFQSGSRVTALRTFSRAERTASGVGVGSSESEVKAKVAAVKCESVSGLRHCYLGKFLPGRRITDFSIRGGRVTSVVVGFVVD